MTVGTLMRLMRRQFCWPESIFTKHTQQKRFTRMRFLIHFLWSTDVYLALLQIDITVLKHISFPWRCFGKNKQIISNPNLSLNEHYNFNDEQIHDGFSLSHYFQVHYIRKSFGVSLKEIKTIPGLMLIVYELLLCL